MVDLFPPAPRADVSANRLRFLDGIRGTSILMLILGHALISQRDHAVYLLPLFDASGAVRIFFVVSGFVISRGLFYEFEATGKVSLAHFFLKRVSKLLPTLLLYVVTAGAVEFFTGGRCQATDYLAAISFTTEIFKSSCWNLAHTWTLSTEEFFYLSWTPLFAYFNVRFVSIALPLVFLISPTLRVLNYLQGHDHYSKMMAWYHPIPLFPYLDIILSGCLFAFLLHRYRHKFVVFHERLPVLVPLALAAIYFWSLPFYKIPALHLLGTVDLAFGPTAYSLAVGYLIAVMACGHRIPLLSGILGLRVLIYLGRISYSLYLWQQLFLIPSGPLNIAWAVAKILAAIIAGSLCFHLFEEPIRKALRRRWRLSL